MIDQYIETFSKMKHFIDNELNNIRSTYIQTPARIVSDYNNEIEKTKDYNGRQLLEMLQNADDESETSINKTAFIQMTETHLTLANNGNPFSEGGVQSLLYSNLSPKAMMQNKIGHKGTGFRSILNWANSIYIKSEGLSIEFSRTNAMAFLDSLVEDHPSISDFLKGKTKEDYPIATLLTPQWKLDNFEQFKEYVTYIVLSIKEEVKIDIQKQIDNLDMEVLLFLQHLECIVIRSPGRNIVMTKKKLNDHQVHINLEENGAIVREKIWNVRKRMGIFEQKNYEVKLAFSDALDDDSYLLYSFFKTDVRLPFPAVMHGTFELTGNRNHLIVSPANDYILNELIQLMIDTALEITNRSKKASWDAMKLLAFDGTIDQNLINMKLDQKLLNKIKENKLFPVISGKYLSYEGRPAFYKNPYADFLPIENFPDLTLYTNDAKLLKLLDQIKLYKYSPQSMFSKLNEISKEWDVKQRAKCIHYLLQDYKNQLNEEENKKLLRIFIDQNGEPVSADTEMFLPPENRHLLIPSYVNMRFIDKGLYKALIDEFLVQGSRALTYKLDIFNVHEYNLESVLRKTVKQTRDWVAQENKNKTTYISELLTFLYDIYRNRKNSEVFPDGINVPLLNRLGNFVETRNLYFGKEYNGYITEQLLGQVDTSLFVGSPKILGLEHFDKEELKCLLSWIGVAEYPRFTVNRVWDDDYERHLYQHVPYPITLEGEMFSHFNALWNVRSNRSTMIVETVERLDEILSTASFAAILIWLLKDPHAHELIIKGTEIDKNSKVLITMRQKRNYRRLYASKIKSYFLWKLQTSKWIENKNSVKVDTRLCCLSKTISSDFSPLIEVPAFDVYREPLSTANILAEEIDALLLKIGIGPDLRNFSTETIYSILLKLPDIDPEGTKARGVYKQIIMSKSKVDNADPTYLNFMKEGKVLVNRNGEKEYFPVTEAYYVENRTLCEDIMKQFPILDLERRSGNQQVRTILGVKSLVGLKFKLSGDPELHPLNEDFQPDLEEFKPFVYAYRLDKDNKHVELDRIKRLRISLCTELRATYLHLNQNHPFLIRDYEYITLDKGYHIYLRLPIEEHEHIHDLRDDFRFNEVIAEIIAGVLRVEENRKDYRELYAKKAAQREELLRRELDDEQIGNLHKARSLLGITTDPTRNFWMSILRATKVNATNLDIESEDNFKRSVASALRLDLSYIHLVWSQLDYEDPGSERSAPFLIRLFKALKIDMVDFNTYSSVRVDLSNYYRTVLDGLKMHYQVNFLSYLFNRMMASANREQQRFIELRDHYVYFKKFDIRNSITFNISSVFSTFLSEEFGVVMTDLEDIERIELQAIYYRNRQELYEQLKPHKVSESQLESFLGKPEYGSLLYFGKLAELSSEYIRSKSLTDSASPFQGANGTSTTSYFTGLPSESYSNLFVALLKESPTSRITTIGTSKFGRAITGGSRGRGSSSRAIQRPSQATNDETGFLGEAHVYLALCEKYGKENVEWVSENARKAKVNEYGNDREKHDLRYINKRGQLKYVEVKTSTGSDTIFHISKEEVNFGEEKKDAYEVFIVLNVNSENLIIRRIPGFFKYGREESFNHNSRFDVENKNFTIRFQEAEGRSHL